jgi:myxalamid-type polyketide synthase MxaB
MATTSEPKDYRELFKRALLKLDDLQAKLDKLDEPIAVIGMSCRFPKGANDPEKFWQLLRDGVNGITEIPAGRWNADDYYDPDPSAPGKMYTRRSGFLDEVDKFDPQFFGIAPREALSMDPQQRLLLEVTWEALECAGQAPPRLAGSRTGVYVGISGNDYSHLQSKSGSSEFIDTYFGAGVAHSIASGRLSYILGLQGPSVSVDTACSASLTAVHLACQSLRLGESDMALAGGVNVILSPDGIITASQARMLSPDGHCKTFDASADGYVRSEGCGIVVLKRLSDALANCDHILALIRGTAANQDGRSNGLTAPNGAAQEAVIREALAKSGVKPTDISYIETHGTGTSLGDPIEVQSLGAVFGEGRSSEKPLLIGAVKSNIGHLEAAAGIAGLIKVILALQHKQLPPSLHVKKLNNYIPWEKLPVKVTTELMPWPALNDRRIAGVSSFGFSGTNVHVVLEEAAAQSDSAPHHKFKEAERGERRAKGEERPQHVLTLSAKSDGALRDLGKRYEKYLMEHPQGSLADICFTTNAGRAHFDHRLALIAESAEQAREKLAAFVSAQIPSALQTGKVEDGSRHEVAFLFTGQGSQYAGMGRQLYETQPTFRKALDKCDELLRPYLEMPLLAVLYPTSAKSNQSSVISDQSKAATDNRSLNTDYSLNQTVYTQPALFAIEYALAELWRSWGIVPSTVMGHSVGEYVAACVAGVFSLKDGIKLIAARARLMQALPQNGMMAAVFTSEEKVSAAIAAHANRVSIAAINGPTNIVISGEREAVSEILKKLERDGVKSKTLAVSHAFHSPLMEPMLDEFENVASQVKYFAPKIGLISNLTGKLAADDEVTTPGYWRRHVRQPVRFAEGIASSHQQGVRLFVEIGPSPTLLSIGQRCLPENSGYWLASLRNGRGDWQTMLETLATLYTQGVNVDWESFDRDYSRQRVVLPTYPFQRARYWAKAAESEKRKAKSEGRLRPASQKSKGSGAGRAKGEERYASRFTNHPLLGQRLRSALQEVQFEAQIDLDSYAYLRDHQFYGMAVFPATAYVEMALAAAKETLGDGHHLVEHCTIHEALFFSEDKTHTVQTIISPDEEGRFTFKIFSLQDEDETKDSWKLHASGELRAVEADSSSAPKRKSLDEIQHRCSQPISTDFFYKTLNELGVDYGPGFRGLNNIWRNEGEALGKIQLPDALIAEAGSYRLHPALLDAGFQLFGASLHGADEKNDAAAVYMPAGIERVRVYRNNLTSLWCHAKLRDGVAANAETLVGDLQLLDEAGDCVALIEGLRFKRASREALLQFKQQHADDWLYQIQWRAAVQPVEAKQPSSRGHWLIFADRAGAGTALAEQFRKQGDDATMVFAAEVFKKLPENTWHVNASSREDFEKLFKEIFANEKPDGLGVFHLWSLDTKVADDASLSELQRAEQLVCGSALNLVQALATRSLPNQPRLWLVTRGAQHVGEEDAQPALAQASLWGLGNVIALEHPALQCARIDLDPARAADDVEALCAELFMNTRENQIAFRGGKRYVARLARCEVKKDQSDGQLAASDEIPLKLEIRERGILENLQLVPMTRRAPGPGEVEIRILATGLNFRDVLNALGMYRGDPGPLGNECIGEVVALGKNVAGLRVGEVVFALAADSFAAYVTTDANFVIRKPANLTIAEAATIPVTFLTASYALNHLAKMSAGNRVLIHAAAGGVGLAAVQLAQKAGAEIFATAGSEQKREYLKSLGVQHVMNSRTLDFADEVMRLTNGKGVDIVLNSLAGDFIEKSLAILRPNGKFLEIGKTGIWGAAKVKDLKPEAHYHVIYLGQTIQEDPALISTLFHDLIAAFANGALKPLPYKEFPLHKAADAYRYMAQAKHIGKVVVQGASGKGQEEEREAKSEERRAKNVQREAKSEKRSTLHASRSTSYALRSDATYLITGGLGALGLHAAKWLVEKGARHVVLVGRKAPSPSTEEIINALKKIGATIVVVQGDISEKRDVEEILQNIAQTLPPLRGIIHAAGGLDDGILLQQDWSRFAKVMAPKIDGAWLLHQLTKDLQLDFFVMFSSIASMFGATGQGNYAAANAFMDALAHFRRSRGLAAMSINWGAWADGGMVTDLGARGEQRMNKSGFNLIAPEQGMKLMEELLSSRYAQAAVVPVNWSKFLQQFENSETPALFSEIAKATPSPRQVKKTPAQSASILQELERVLPSERLDLLTAHVREQVIKVLGLDASQSPEPNRGLTDLGMDSLMAVELSNRLQGSLRRSLPSTLAFEYPTIAALTNYIAKDVLALETEFNGKAEAPHKQNGQSTVSEEIAQLADDELEGSLLKELDSAGY